LQRPIGRGIELAKQGCPSPGHGPSPFPQGIFRQYYIGLYPGELEAKIPYAILSELGNITF